MNPVEQGAVGAAVRVEELAALVRGLAGRLEELVLASRSDPGVLIYELHRSRIHVINFAVGRLYTRLGVGSQMIA